MSACESWHERLSAGIDGELPPPVAAALEEHVAHCPGCAAEADHLRAVEAALRRASTPTPELEGRTARRLAAPRARVRRPLAAAAAVLAGVAAALWVARGPLVPEDAAPSIARSLANLEALEDRRARDRRALLRTFAWELTAMRLELACLRPERERGRALTSRIDRLLARLEPPERSSERNP